MDNTLVKFSPKASSKLHHQAHHVRHTTGVASNLPDCTAARRPEHEVVHYVLLAGTARVHQTRTTFTTPVEPKTWTFHGPVGSGRPTAGRRGGAGLGRTGPGRTGRCWVDPAKKQPSLLSPSESRTLSRTIHWKHEQSNSYLKRTEEQNPRLTSG